MSVKLSDHDLAQMDEEYLDSLTADTLRPVTKKLLLDLKEARDRLNQNPQNSSMPPSSQSPFFGTPMEDADLPETNGEASNAGKGKREPTSPQDGKNDKEEADSSDNGNTPETSEETRRSPGKQVGAPGYGRTQVIPPHAIEEHKADHCSACDGAIPEDAPFTAGIAYYMYDLQVGTREQPGLTLIVTKHIFGDSPCDCGHVTRTRPGHGERYHVDGRKEDTSLSEWRLAGPMLAAFIVSLATRMRLSRLKIQEWLKDWFELEIAVGTINRCIHEAGLATAPVYDHLIEQVRGSGLVHVDETPWKERSRLLWLWVFATSHTVLFFVGRRTRQVALGILTETYAGWLMSDGLMNYRSFPKRLRCMAHLIRKSRGLAESLDKEGRDFGQMALEVIGFLIEHSRDGPKPEVYQPILDDFRKFCEWFRDVASHEKTRQLAVEFLNDWDVIWLVLKYPWLPLTNNEAERALRHWVIARLISQGTRTPEGSRVLATLASVIETCRKRGVSPWRYLAEVIAERRRGNVAPQIPLPVAA